MRKEKIGMFVLPSFFGCICFTHFDYIENTKHLQDLSEIARDASLSYNFEITETNTLSELQYSK